MTFINHRPQVRQSSRGRGILCPWEIPIRTVYVCLDSRRDGHRLGEGEHDDFFTGDGADVVVQALDLDAGDVLDHRLEQRPRRLEQVGSYLLEQVPPVLGRERLDQVLFGGGQDALEADHEEIADPVRADVLGSRAHIFLLEARDPVADGGLDLPLRLHGDSQGDPPLRLDHLQIDLLRRAPIRPDTWPSG
jgi:hypothetical protein